MSKTNYFLTVILLTFMACQKEDDRTIDTTYQPEINPANFSNSTVMTNPYFPVPANLTYTYEGQTADGHEMVQEQRQNYTRVVDGIECIVVLFRAYLDGHLIEEAKDWYAQDNAGTVWYFGEEVDNYNLDGTFDNHDGSWEAGVDGAQPGIIMPANPMAGQKYREEYYFNVAEDEAEIIQTGQSISITFGNFTACITTKNFTELEPDLLENKFYAPGIGLIKESDPGHAEVLELVSIQ